MVDFDLLRHAIEPCYLGCLDSLLSFAMAFDGFVRFLVSVFFILQICFLLVPPVCGELASRLLTISLRGKIGIAAGKQLLPVVVVLRR